MTDATATVPTTFAVVTLPAPELGRILSNMLLAAAPTRDARPALASVLVEHDAGKLTFRATDSYWLLRETVDCDTACGGPLTVLLERDDLAPIAKLAASREQRGATATLAITDSASCAITLDEVTVTLPSLDSTFPNVDQLIDAWQPAGGAVDAIAVAPQRLTEIAKVMPPNATRSDLRPVKFQFGADATKAVRLSWSNAPGMVGLVMPCMS